MFSNDYTFFQDSFGKTHARISQRAVAEWLGVSHTAIRKLLFSGNLKLDETSETVTAQGFDGGNLAAILEYYAFESNQVSVETKKHCRSLYRKVSSKSLQEVIDEAAGLTQVLQNNQQTQPEISEDHELGSLLDFTTNPPTIPQQIKLLDLILQYLKIGHDSMAYAIAQALGIRLVAEASDNVALATRVSNELRQCLKQDVEQPQILVEYISPKALLPSYSALPETNNPLQTLNPNLREGAILTKINGSKALPF